MYHVFYKNIEQQKLFESEWFLKDHVIPKTENSALPS